MYKIFGKRLVLRATVLRLANGRLWKCHLSAVDSFKLVLAGKLSFQAIYEHAMVLHVSAMRTKKNCVRIYEKEMCVKVAP